ncbi:MAG: hypothetical protein ACC656_12580, partial [Candidatus Heimdallarchaeota archaeon]
MKYWQSGFVLMFSKEILSNAKNHILKHARPIDKALYLFEFEDDPKQDVIDQLKHYQNRDGGFGHGLEPDIQMPRSSVIATTVAFQYINEIKQFPDEIIKPAINFFLKTIQKFPVESELNYFWYLTPMEVNSSPHAPWWNIKEQKPPENEEWPNISVEVIGYLLQFSHLVPRDLIKELTDDLNTYLHLVPELTGFIYFKFLCFKRILNQIPKTLQKEIFKMLDNTFSTSNHLNEKSFEHIKIQWMITERSSYLYQKYPEIINNLLKQEVDRLGTDGGSHPKWKWGEDDLWGKIEKNWSGK